MLLYCTAKHLYDCTQLQAPSKTKHNIKRKEKKNVPQRQPQAQQGKYTDYLKILKYKIKTIAVARTAIMGPIIHLFMLILFDILVVILLHFPVLSSTPCSRNIRKSSGKYSGMYSQNYYCGVKIIEFW